jgi:hypothetical protein
VIIQIIDSPFVFVLFVGVGISDFPCLPHVVFQILQTKEKRINTGLTRSYIDDDDGCF